MEIDHRRCSWCRRLCRYFGPRRDAREYFCRRCYMWCEQRQMKSNMNLSCSGRMVPEKRWGLLFRTSPYCENILYHGCGSMWELDMSVSTDIWRSFLLGDIPDEGTTGVFWMLSPKGCKSISSLAPCYNGTYRYERILCVIIAFLGPFRPCMIEDGSFWKRG